MTARLDSDNLAWDLADELWESAIKHVKLTTTCRKIEAFASRVFPKPATLVPPLVIGGFNVLYPLRIDGLPPILVRQPCPNQAVFPEEKTRVEAATAAFVAQRTGVPTPRVLKYGVDPEIGPFLVLRDLGTRRDMTDAMQAPRKDPGDTPILDPDIEEGKLKGLYAEMARCTLHLAQPTFPRIGALVEESGGDYVVAERPFTMNMNNMVRLSNIPASIFPAKGTTYQTASGWYAVLAEMQIATLVFQHNDVVTSEDDCRTKYVSRQLFRRLATQGKLATFGFAEDDWSASPCGTLHAPDGEGLFRVWSDDFRPANVMVDEDDRVLGVIDWEFAYVAPTQFVLDPPWWLLLDQPEMWEGGIDEWTKLYATRLQTWLSAMEEAEKDLKVGALRLSGYMRESWATGRFWLNYAARKSWAFDAIYWKFLDESFFGDREGDGSVEELWKTRVQLLSDEERAMMETLVEEKMGETKEKVLVEWDAIEAEKRLTSFLFE